MHIKFRSKVSKITAVVLLIACSLQPIYAVTESEIDSLKEQQEELEQEQELTGERLEAAQKKVEEMDATILKLDEKIGAA